MSAYDSSLASRFTLWIVNIRMDISLTITSPLSSALESKLYSSFGPDDRSSSKSLLTIERTSTKVSKLEKQKAKRSDDQAKKKKNTNPIIHHGNIPCSCK
jgi:hypothetical protein